MIDENNALRMSQEYEEQLLRQEIKHNKRREELTLDERLGALVWTKYFVRQEMHEG